MHLVKKRVIILTKEEIRKHRKKILIIILAILIGYILIFRIPWLSMIARYDTPEKAVAVALGIMPSQITKTIEYKDIAFVIWEKSDYQTNYDFFAKDKRGWIPKANSNTLGEYYSTLGKGYTLTFFKCYDKYVMFIHTNEVAGYSKDSVSDNLGSEFKYYENVIKNESLGNKEMDKQMTDQIWFTVLDEKPEQYSIKVGDEVTEIIK